MQYAIVIDSETTGKRSFTAQIIEAAAVVVDSAFQEVDHFHTMVNPGEEAIRLAAPKALQKNGISVEEIRSGVPMELAAASFNEFRSKYPHAKMHAYNNEFDRWFFAKPPWNVPEKGWGECIMVASMEIMKEAGVLELFKDGTAKWPSLENSSKFFEVPYGIGHRALPDARVAAAVYGAIHKFRMSPEVIEMEEEKYITEDGM